MTVLRPYHTICLQGGWVPSRSTIQCRAAPHVPVELDAMQPIILGPETARCFSLVRFVVAGQELLPVGTVMPGILFLYGGRTKLMSPMPLCRLGELIEVMFRNDCDGGRGFVGQLKGYMR